MKHLDNHGATLIEYALVVSLVTITAIAGIKGLSGAIAGKSNSVSSKIGDAFNEDAS